MSLSVANITSYPRITPLKALVYIGKTNTIELSVDRVYPASLAAVQEKWAGVTRMVLHVVSLSNAGAASELIATADTDADPALIDYSEDGLLGLNLGGLLTLAGGVIPEGEYLMRLTKYSGSVQHQILHEQTQIARLQFVNVDEVG